MENKQLNKKPKVLTLSYDTDKMTIEQTLKNGLVLDVYENKEFLGCLCGSDIRTLLEGRK